MSPPNTRTNTRTHSGKPEWTVAQAKALRSSVAENFARKRRYMPSIAEPLTRVGLKWANAIPGVSAYEHFLKRTSERMNRNLETAFDQYSPGTNDVIAAAYFKAGTNWVMHICHQICHLGGSEFEHIQDVMPWPDAAQPMFWQHINDPLAYESPTGKRVIKSHLPANKMPINNEAKYIVVIRDPKDCAASGYYFFHSLIFGPTMPPPDRWLQHFSSNDAPMGPWHEFAASWYPLRHQHNVLFLHFEDMKANPQKTVDDIASFINVDLTEDARSKVIAKTSFSAMKAANEKFYPANQSIWTAKNGSIIRKGSIGDSANLFSADSLMQFDLKVENALLELQSDYPYRNTYMSLAYAGGFE